jgi:predicted pyridoxine 5'-phosphate oxidase superfamily flavin-nucleotide-binding protein
MGGTYHAGELEVQRRAGAREQARALSRAVFSEIPAAALRFLARQRLVIAASVAADGNVWASLLTGPPGFVSAVDARLLCLATRPPADDPLHRNLAARPELGLLVFDPGTRQRMRFNGRGLLAAEGVFLEVQQAYGNCAK